MPDFINIIVELAKMQEDALIKHNTQLIKKLNKIRDEKNTANAEVIFRADEYQNEDNE
jgi:hypothetical protein